MEFNFGTAGDDDCEFLFDMARDSHAISLSTGV